MSKERARRRAEREAAAAIDRARRMRRNERRQRRRALVQRLTPRLPDRRTGRLLARRTRGERAAIVAVGVGLLTAVWLVVDHWPTRIGLSLLVLVLMPVLVIVAFDRRV